MKYPLLVCLTSAALMGCNGGGSNTQENPQIEVTPEHPNENGFSEGFIRDAAIEGLHYQTGDHRGVTDKDGRFEYSQGDEVTFYLGSSALGKVEGAKLITPLELTNTKNYTNQAPANMVRLLMALDADGNAENGIEITSELQEYFSSGIDLSGLSFSSDTFESDLNALADRLGETIYLPNTDAAHSHFQETLSCAYSGLYIGDFFSLDASENGRLATVIEPTSLTATSALIYSDDYSILLKSNSLALASEKRSLQWGQLSNEIIFIGEFADYQRIEGLWEDMPSALKGTFSMTKIEQPVAIEKYVVKVVTAPEQVRSDYGIEYDVFFEVLVQADGKARVNLYNLQPPVGLTSYTSPLEYREGAEPAVSIYIPFFEGYQDSKISMPLNRSYKTIETQDQDGNQYRLEVSHCRI